MAFVLSTRHFASDIRCAQQPNTLRLEQRRCLPNQAIELLVMHGGTARYVLHLHQVAPRILVCAHNFLRIVGKENERQHCVKNDMDNNSACAIRNLQQRPHMGNWAAATRMRAFFFSEPERESPCVDDPHLDNPRVANPHRENPAQRNTHGIKYQSINQT